MTTTLQIGYSGFESSTPKIAPEGRRVTRRKDNACFVGNPHIVPARKSDYAIQPPSAKSTFPEPLPPYLPRTAVIPAAAPPARDPISANAGRFSLSLKGVRRELRGAGYRVQVLVHDIEHEMLEWLSSFGGSLQSQPEQPAQRRPIGETKTVCEVSRTPLELVWAIGDDPFARYVVHCCARYHEIVSFSKDDNGERFTHLLRPNVTRPDHRAHAIVDTPPATDIESVHLSQQDSDTDFGESDGESMFSVIQPWELNETRFPHLPSPSGDTGDGQVESETESVASLPAFAPSRTEYFSYIRARRTVAPTNLRPGEIDALREPNEGSWAVPERTTFYSYLFL